MSKQGHKTIIFIFFSYLILTLFFTYPLILHINSHIPAKGISDAAIFVWNTWNFETQILNAPHNPLIAPTLIYPFQPNLTFHTYNIFRNVTVMLLSCLFKPILSFNLITVLMFIFSAIGAYFLTLRFVKNHFAAFVSGLIFSFCPFKLARLGGHFNFIDAVFIPIYIIFLFKSFEKKGIISPVLAGFFLSMVGYCSYYYLVFAILFTVLFAGYSTFPTFRSFITQRYQPQKKKKTLRIVSLMIGFPTVLIMLYVTFVDSIRLHAREINRIEIFVVILTFLLALNIHLRLKVSMTKFFSSFKKNIAYLYRKGIFFNSLILLLVFLLFFSPLLVNALKFSQDYLAERPIVKNYPEIQDFFSYSGLNSIKKVIVKPRQYNLKRIVFLGYVALLLGLSSLTFLKKKKYIGFWHLVSLVFLVLTLGPFLKIQGREILWLPYHLIQAIPIIQFAREPARYIMMTMLALGILSAYSIENISIKIKKIRWSNTKTRVAAVLLIALISIEYLTIPIPIYDITPPRFYKEIEKDSGRYAVLDIPWRIYGKKAAIGKNLKRAGLFQYYQTAHNKILLSGNLSNVPSGIYNYYKKNVFIQTLVLLQDPQVDVETKTMLLQKKTDFPAENFISLYNIRYFILHKYDLKDSLSYIINFLNKEIPGLRRIEENEELLVYEAPEIQENFFLNKNLLLPENELTLVQGWSRYIENQKKKGRKATKKSTTLVFSIIQKNHFLLKFEMNLPQRHRARAQKIKIFINNSLLAKIKMDSISDPHGKKPFEIKIPKEKVLSGSNILKFKFHKLYDGKIAAWFNRIEIDNP